MEEDNIEHVIFKNLGQNNPEVLATQNRLEEARQRMLEERERNQNCQQNQDDQSRWR